MAQVTIDRDEVQTLATIAADLHTIAMNFRTADASILALALAQVDSMLDGWAKWLANEADKQADEVTQYEIFMSQPPKPIEAAHSRYVFGHVEE